MSALAEPRDGLADPTPPPREPARHDRLALAAFAALLVVGIALLAWLGRETTFYFDEWDWVQGRRAWTAGALLEPHNEHLSLVPVLLYKLLFSTAGLEHYGPYRALGLLAHALVVVALFVYARRRVGDVLALAAAALMLFLGTGWNDVLWPFQTGFLTSLAAGLAALLALDRETRRGDVVASLLLAVALASSSLGIPLAGALAVEVLGRPDRRRRWWVIAAPLALYALWWLGYGSGGAATLDNFFDTPRYVADAAAGAVGALAGLGPEWGRVLAPLAALALVLALRDRAGLSWRLGALIALPLLFWGLTGLARADLHEPAASRYLYPGALFVLLIAIEAGAGRRLSRRGLALLAPLFAAALIANVGEMRDGAGWLRDRAAEVKGGLAGMALAPAGLSPSFQPEPAVAPQIRAGSYLAAVRDLGSPVPSPRSLPSAFERTREHADATLTRAAALRLAPATSAAGAAPRVEAAERAAVTRRGSCVSVTSQGGSVQLAVPRGVVVLPDRGTTTVAVRRFADVYGAPLGTAEAGRGAQALRIRPDASPAPWHARLVVDGTVRACGATS